MAEPTYDPYAYSPLGERISKGASAYRIEGDPRSGYLMNIFWFNPVTGEEGQTTEGWSRVPDEHKPYVYRDPGLRNEAKSTFYQSGAAFGGAGGFGDMSGGLLSGQAYAQQIAGGMPFEQVVAPGMSFSPDQPMGYIAEGATPFQPRAFPVTGEDLGLPTGEGTPMPAGTTFEGLLGGRTLTDAQREELGLTSDFRGPFGLGAGSGTYQGPIVEPSDIDINELLKDIDVQQAIENLPTPVATPQPVAAPMVSTPIAPPVLPEIIPERQPVMPSMPIAPPVLEAPTPIVDVPMNLGLPMLENLAPVQIPEIPFQLPQISQPVSIPTLPVVNTPVMPQPMVNLGMTPTNPVLSIDNIVSPIRQGSPRALLGTL